MSEEEPKKAVATVKLSLRVFQTPQSIEGFILDYAKSQVAWDGVLASTRPPPKSDEERGRKLVLALIAYKLGRSNHCDGLKDVVRRIKNSRRKGGGNQNFVCLFGKSPLGNGRFPDLFDEQSSSGLSIDPDVLPKESITVELRIADTGDSVEADAATLELLIKGVHPTKGHFIPQPFSGTKSISPPVLSAKPTGPFTDETEEICHYLEQIAAQMGRLPWVRPDESTPFFERLHIQVRVARNRWRGASNLAPEQANYEAGTDAERNAGRDYQNRADLTTFLQRPTEPPTPWHSSLSNDTRRQHPWAVILADPGLGKTTLLKYEGWMTAHEEIKKLKDDPLSVNDALIPIFIGQSELADESKDEEIEELLLQFAIGTKNVRQPATSKRLRSFLRRQIRAGKLVLLLDGHDEVREGQHAQIDRRLNELLALEPTRVYFSSRHAGYRGNYLQRGERPVPEMEIVAFRPDEIRRFVEAYFAGVHDRDGTSFASAVWTAMESRPDLIGLTQNPLLITMLCVAVWERHLSGASELRLPNHRGELYAECVRGMLGGWSMFRQRKRGDPGVRIANDDEWVIPRRQLLAQLAWELPGYRMDRKAFSWDDVNTCLKRHDKLIRQIGCSTSEEAVEHLAVQSGLLGSQGSSYMFLHLTFQEYLVAYFLSQIVNKHGWQAQLTVQRTTVTVRELINHVAWLPTWQEIIPLFCAELEQPIPLLELLFEAGRDDCYRHRLALAARCLSELQGTPRPKTAHDRDKLLSLGRSIIDATLDCCIEIREEQRQATGVKVPSLGSHLERCLPALARWEAKQGGRSRWADALLQEIDEPDREHRYAALAIMRSLPPEQSPWPIERLFKLLDHDDVTVRTVAATCLSRHRGSRFIQRDVERLIENFHSTDLALGMACADALASMDGTLDPQITARVISLIQDQNGRLRQVAAKAIAGWGERLDESHREKLRHLCHDPDPGICSAAVIASSGFATHVTKSDFEFLRALLSNTDLNVQHAAAAALACLRPQIDDVQFSHLASLLRDSNPNLRYAALHAFSGMNGQIPHECLDEFIRLVEDTDGGVRAAAARAIEHSPGLIRPIHLDSLRRLLTHDSPGVRHAAACALGGLSDHLDSADVELLLRSLQDHDEGVRTATGRALAAVRWRLKPHIKTLMAISDRADEVTKHIILMVLGPLLFNDENPIRLIEIAKGPVGVRYLAIEAIGELGDNATQLHLDFLLRVIRNDGFQDGGTGQSIALHSLQRWQSFGWRIVSINGCKALRRAAELAQIGE